MILSNEQIADRLADENYTGVPDEKDYLDTLVCFRQKFLDEMERTGLLASATDLLNSWAREMSIQEAHDELDIKGVIDRLWSALSTEMSRSAQKSALLRQMLKDAPNASVEHVLEAIEGK